MQIEILPPGDDGQVEHQFNSSTIPKPENAGDEWEWRGYWLMRHHIKPRRSAFRPDLQSSELAQLDLEDFKAMICQEYP
eukprot:12444821-Prorocentrum_lima.AAC.1